MYGKYFPSLELTYNKKECKVERREESKEKEESSNPERGKDCEVDSRQ